MGLKSSQVKLHIQYEIKKSGRTPSHLLKWESVSKLLTCTAYYGVVTIYTNYTNTVNKLG